jgi:AraC family transcriptional regulator
MQVSDHHLITSLPDCRQKGFQWEAHNQVFKEKNVIIHARSNQADYPEHWGPLSIKSAFKGNENYRLNRGEVAVNENNYLIINEGNYYSSYIDSDKEVESFTINFSPALVQDALASIRLSATNQLEGREGISNEFNFFEHLHPHNEIVSPHIFRLRELTSDFKSNHLAIEETFLKLLHGIFIRQLKLEGELHRLPAQKYSTRIELYRRLMKARDYMESCYQKQISIASLASLCLLNQTYFLRQFQQYFKITPAQYLIRKRMEVARQCLEQNKEAQVKEICLEVGYSDASSFSKMFKRLYGIAPENYQQNYPDINLEKRM